MPKQLVNVNVSDADRQKLVTALHNNRGVTIHVSRGGPIPVMLKNSDQKRLAKAVRGKIKVTLTKKDVQDTVMSGSGFFEDLWGTVKSIAKPIAQVARIADPILRPAIKMGAQYLTGADPNTVDTALNVTDKVLQQVGIGIHDPRIPIAKRRKAMKDLEKIGGALYSGNALYASQSGRGCGCRGGALSL